MRPRWLDHLLLVVSLAFVLFHLAIPVYAFLPGLQERAIHLGLALILVFLGGRKQRSRLDWLVSGALAAAGTVICAYVVVRHDAILEQYGSVEGWEQLVMGIVLVLVVLEMARRSVRPALPTIACLFLLYLALGHHLPGGFGHPRYDLDTMVSVLFLDTGGLWGQLLGVSANIIAIFVFLGAFIMASGGGDGFMKVSLRLAGRYRGGPAKVAAVASALFGSISGSASANVASTGAFTIPMMKRLGYRPALAGAVEAVASTGGQIMPPIMGAGAFVMAELIQTPYIKIAAAAALPSILYFATVILGIHFYSGKLGYQGLPEKDLPGWAETAKASTFFLIPFLMLGYWLYLDYTPQYGAFWAVLCALVIAWFDKDWKPDLKAVWPRYRQAALSGAHQAAVIAAICACAQIIVAVIAQTGAGLKFTNAIVGAVGDNLLLALLLTGLTSVLLGMEVPTTAAYIVAVVVGGPVLEGFGVPPLAGHLFIFYLAILSAITPPVCGAVFIAAGMAGADWVQTAKVGLRLAFAAFILPFLFAYQPGLLLIGGLGDTIWAFVTGFIAMALISAGFMGYLRADLGTLARLALMGAGCFFLPNDWWLNLIGAVMAGAVWLGNRPRPAGAGKGEGAQAPGR